MLFDDAMAAHVRAVRAFYADPGRNLLILRVDPDLEYVAARFLAELGQADGVEGDVSDAPLVIGVSAELLDAAAFYREAAAQIAEALAPVAEAYRAEDPELVLPDALAPERADGAAIETRFAAYVEQIARGLGSWHETVVFVLRFERVDGAVAAASLARLAGSIGGPAVKLIVLDDLRVPSLPTPIGLRTRYAAAHHDARHGDGLGRLTALVGAHDTRVLGLALRERNVAELRRAAEVLARDRPGTAAVFVAATFATRLQFADAIVRALAPDERGSTIHDLRALDRPEASLVERIEQVFAGRGCERPLVLIRATAIDDPHAWTAFVHGLVGACARVETKFVVLDVDGAAPVPEAPATRVEIGHHDFTLGIDDAVAALERIAARPELAPGLRVAHLTMLANIRIGQGRAPEAAELAAESVTLARTHALVAPQIAGWWTLGCALQRAGSLDAARNAFCESTDLALREGNFVGAAQGLLGVGHTYHLAGDWAAAIHAYRLSQENWRDAGQAFGECQALIWIGESLRKARRHDEADAHFQRVVDIYRAMRAPFEAMAEGGLADVYERIAANFADAGRKTQARAFRSLACDCGSHGPVPDRPV